MMYYYLYCIINNENNKFYFGVHSTDNLNDGYMGSGKALKASQELHGIDKFTKFILEFFDTEEEMYAREREIVTERAVKDPNCYNLTVGGKGSNFGRHLSEEHRRRISESNKGKPVPEERRRRISTTLKGIQPSIETRKKISIAMKGKPAPTKGRHWRLDPVTNKRIYF